MLPPQQRHAPACMVAISRCGTPATRALQRAHFLYRENYSKLQFKQGRHRYYTWQLLHVMMCGGLTEAEHVFLITHPALSASQTVRALITLSEAVKSVVVVVVHRVSCVRTNMGSVTGAARSPAHPTALPPPDQQLVAHSGVMMRSFQAPESPLCSVWDQHQCQLALMDHHGLGTCGAHHSRLCCRHHHHRQTQHQAAHAAYPAQGWDSVRDFGPLARRVAHLRVLRAATAVGQVSMNER